MDYLHKIATHTGGKIREQNLFSNNFKQKSFRNLTIKNFNGYKVYIDDFGDLCFIGIKVNCKRAFSINNPDEDLFFKTPIHVNHFPQSIYVSRRNSPIENEEIKTISQVFVQLLKKLDFTSEESVFVSADTLAFGLQTNRDLIYALEGIMEMLLDNTNLFKRPIRKIIRIKDIPENLRMLAPLFKKYSISDDAERAQLIESLSNKRKKQLIESVNPFMKEINAYLASFGENLPTEEATMVGDLAQLVTELQINHRSL